MVHGAAAHKAASSCWTNDPFAPPLPGDAALASDSERGFEKLMDAWTLEARGKRYVDGEDDGPEAT